MYCCFCFIFFLALVLKKKYKYFKNNCKNTCIIQKYAVSLVYTKQQKRNKMTTQVTKQEQSNYYNVVDSMGRATDIYYCASNINDAFKAFKADRANYQKYYYGKLKRCYNGGVRGSVLN